MKRMRAFCNDPWGKGKMLEEEVNNFLKALSEDCIPEDDISLHFTSSISDKYDVQFVAVYVVWNTR